jgi:sporulation protein YlmC with PRC-barrel domain
MNAVHMTPVLAALCFGSIALAQAQQEPADPRPATSEAEGTAADRTPPDPSATNPSTTNPSTTRPVRPGEQIDPRADPRPSTNPAEGTAADSTPPGQTPTTQTPTTAGATSTQRSELVGAAVVTPSGAAIGKVVDVVFDSVAQPAYVVIASESGPAAVPYAVASSMKSSGKVVIDQARLKSAPKVKDGEWRTESGSHWQQDSTRYWEKGG